MNGNRGHVSKLAWIVLFLACCQVGLELIYLRDEHFLTKRLDEIAPRSLPSSELTLRTLELFKELPIDSNEDYFLLPPFHFLRATSREILQNGGDCADRSRLLITLLHTRGVFASKWALYSTELHPAHSVIEVHTEKGRMAVDPFFGLWFPEPDGGYYSVEDLRHDPSLLYDRVRYQQKHQLQTGAADINRYPLKVYIYGLARTINWNKSATEYICYRVLHAVIGNKANYIPGPRWVEEPSLVVLVLVTILQFLVLAVWIPGRNPSPQSVPRTLLFPVSCRTKFAYPRISRISVNLFLPATNADLDPVRAGIP